MDLVLAKVISLCIILVITLICCLLPLKVISHGKKSSSVKFKRLLSYCNCVAGGVFIGTCFLALLPQVYKMFDKIKSEITSLDHVPLTEVVLVLGFFLILFIEQLVLTCKETCYSDNLPPGGVTVSVDQLAIDGYTASESSSDTEQEVYSAKTHEKKKLVTGKKKMSGRVKINSYHSGQTPVSPFHEHGHGHSHNGASGHHSHLPDLSSTNSMISTLILLLALGSHSLFEGMALGLQESNEMVLRLSIAILSHEALCSLAMGITLAQQSLKLATVVKIALIFCSLIPIGIVIGMIILTVGGSVGLLLSATIQGIAAGTFIHVIFFELIPPEMGPEFGRLIKVLFLFLGCAVMGSLSFFHSHQHSLVNATHNAG